MKLSIVTKVYPVRLQFVKNNGKSDDIQIQFDALRNTFNLVDKANTCQKAKAFRWILIFMVCNNPRNLCKSHKSKKERQKTKLNIGIASHYMLHNFICKVSLLFVYVSVTSLNPRPYLYVTFHHQSSDIFVTSTRSDLQT